MSVDDVRVVVTKTPAAAELAAIADKLAYLDEELAIIGNELSRQKMTAADDLLYVAGTCLSGAIEKLREQALKSALRELQQ